VGQRTALERASMEDEYHLPNRVQQNGILDDVSEILSGWWSPCFKISCHGCDAYLA
jgi:hypothetical protein